MRSKLFLHETAKNKVDDMLNLLIIFFALLLESDGGQDPKQFSGCKKGTSSSLVIVSQR
jgi:hypothetical protein